MQTDVLKQILANTDIVVEPASVTQLGDKSWSACTPDGPVLLRFVQDSDVHTLRAVRALVVGSPERFHLLQRIDRCVDAERGVVAVMEWIPGTTLRDHYRDELPAFFGQLATWHRVNAGALPLYSRYTNREYCSVEEYLSDELGLHLRTAKGVVTRNVCWGRRHPLSSGFPTYTHGDVHPGNIIKGTDGRYRLLDPEYLHIGVNYLDLDYLDWHGLDSDPPPWWTIRQGACECVAAYFAVLGISTDRIAQIMTAVRLLTALRGHTNGVRRGTTDAADLLTRLRKIMDGPPEPEATER